MILSRISHAIRQQNWFAVVLEFIIVIAGVVIGFQITAWNEARLARIDEARLIEQLRVDVAEAMVSKRDWIDNQSGRNAQLSSAIDLIQNPERGNAISPEQCDAAWQSHIVVPPPSRLTTLDEILTTRGLDSVSEPALRLALLNYRSGAEEIREMFAFIRDDFSNVVDDFPEAMPRHLDLLADINETTCNLDVMRSSQALQNRLMSNLGRANGAVTYATREYGLLGEVQDALPEATP